jgi:uncharacterized protein (UPF0303 family)
MSVLDVLKRQEEVLVFDGFDETTAFAVGTALRDAAWARQAAVVIDIRSASRRLYFAALPGATPDNEEWARRKGNVVLRCHAASWCVGLTLQAAGRSAWPDAALATAEFATHGGGFPVRVQGTGVVASIAVSGLPSRDDHDIIATTLARHLGVSDCPATPA